MIDAVIYKRSQGVVQGFKIKGHALYDEPGSDIVCSAVSAIVFTALGGMDELQGLQASKKKTVISNALSLIILPVNSSSTTQIILKTMDIGLRQIEADYNQYVRVRYEEV